MLPDYHIRRKKNRRGVGGKELQIRWYQVFLSPKSGVALCVRYASFDHIGGTRGRQNRLKVCQNSKFVNVTFSICSFFWGRKHRMNIFPSIFLIFSWFERCHRPPWTWGNSNVAPEVIKEAPLTKGVVNLWRKKQSTCCCMQFLPISNPFRKCNYKFYESFILGWALNFTKKA